MKARVVEEHFFNLDRKLVEHEKGQHFLKMFELTMSIPKNILQDALYYISNRGDCGEGVEVVRVYFVNPYQGDTADTFFLANIRKSCLPKTVHLSKETEIFWSNNIKENVKEVYNIDWMFDFDYKVEDVAVISKNTGYFEFIDSLYANIKEEYKIFLNTEYEPVECDLSKDRDIRIGKNLYLWVGNDGKYQIIPLIDSHFKTEESEPYYKNVAQEFSVYSKEIIKEYF